MCKVYKCENKNVMDTELCETHIQSPICPMCGTQVAYQFLNKKTNTITTTDSFQCAALDLILTDPSTTLKELFEYLATAGKPLNLDVITLTMDKSVLETFKLSEVIENVYSIRAKHETASYSDYHTNVYLSKVFSTILNDIVKVSINENTQKNNGLSAMIVASFLQELGIAF